MTILPAVLTLALATVALMANGEASRELPTASDAASGALAAAQRLQDDARVLRNGARTGATVATFDRLHLRLRRERDLLVNGHQHWRAQIPASMMADVAADSAAAESHFQQIDLHLSDLQAALQDGVADRARVSVLGQRIGRHAAQAERALGRSVRRVASVPLSR
jgi:hypothetical protein